MVRVVDLTHHFENGMPVFPGLTDPSFEPIARVEDQGYAMTEYSLLNHIGTHVDAPAHQVAGGDTLDDIPVNRLVTDAVVFDFSDRPPGPIGLREIGRYLDVLRPGDWAFVFSNNSRNWGTDAYWTGWSYPDADASRALIGRGITGVGFDGPSCDPVDSTTFDLHRVWLGAGRLILENLSNLDQIPARVPVVVAPLKVRGANGAPSRVFALVSDQKGSHEEHG